MRKVCCAVSLAIAPGKRAYQYVSQYMGGVCSVHGGAMVNFLLAPQTCDMSKAVRDYHPDGGALTREKGKKGTYSPTGIWGDPTLASREKGERLVEALLAGVLADIEAIRTAPLPEKR